MSETEYKYTKDGKKVAVISKLNNEEWIVQEIFVSNGKEYPAGENFVERTLLDEPAETYQSRRAKEAEESLEKLKCQMELLEKESRIKRRKRDAVKLINQALEKYQDMDFGQLDTLFAFLAGEITHLVISRYSDYRIVSLVDGIEAVDNHGSWQSLDGLRMVSLFGCREYCERYKDDRTLRLDWKINEYRDSSGSWREFWPCSSHEEAVQKLDELLAGEKDVCEKLIELKKKYKLANPTKKKIKEYYARCVESKKEYVASAKTALKEKEKELSYFEPSGYYYDYANEGAKEAMSEKMIQVFCGDCQTYFDEEKVEFVDIEEDIQGHDVMTFKCPICKKEKRSKRLG